MKIASGIATFQPLHSPSVLISWSVYSSGHLRFHRSQLLGWVTLQRWGPFPGMCEALLLTPPIEKARRSQLCFSHNCRAWAVSAETSSSPASQLSGPLVCHTEVRLTAELKRCPGFSACKITCCAYKCVGVWPYKLRNNYPHLKTQSPFDSANITRRAFYLRKSEFLFLL